MGIVDLFSKRQKRLNGEMPDVYEYATIPMPLRVQITHIIKDTIGVDQHERYARNSYEYIHKTLCKEYGVFSLKDYCHNDSEAIFDYFLNCDEYDKCLDIIELSFKIIENYIKPHYSKVKSFTTSSQKPDDAIAELNTRFQENGIGYHYISGEIIRIDSQYIHSETVKPVLSILGSEKKYDGSNAEFLSAHEHYRHKRYKESLNDCLKSFESLMKAIHEINSWPYNKNDTAKKLINNCLTHGLIPEYLQTQFSSIRSLLESGVPTVRNKEGGHGQGSEEIHVPEYLASYALHLTASNLLFLANCEKNYN